MNNALNILCVLMLVIAGNTATAAGRQVVGVAVLLYAVFMTAFIIWRRKRGV